MSDIQTAIHKAHGLPEHVDGIDDQQLKQINNNMIEDRRKNKPIVKRGQYAVLSNDNKFRVARFAFFNGVTKTLRNKTFANFDLKESTVIGWKNKFSKAYKVLGRHPRTAAEAGLVNKKRGRRSCLGDKIRGKVCKYLKNLRDSGADVTYYTTQAAIKAVLLSEKKGHMLQDKGGWINPSERGLIQEIWKQCKFKKRKKGSKRRVKSQRNSGFIAAQYKLRCKLIKRKYHIHDAHDMNADESLIPMVPKSDYTMDEQGSTEVLGERMDDKRGVTGFFLGAKTGEGAKVQCIYEGKTDRCHPRCDEPDNVVFDHSENHWSDPDTTHGFVEDVLLPFYESQRRKYHLPYGSHALLRWDVYYTHRLDDILLHLQNKYPFIHIVFVPAGETDKLQQMDVAVNKPMKGRLKVHFVDWRCAQSMQQMANGISANDVYVDYGLVALKIIHVKWVSEAWDYVIKSGFIKNAFTKVEKNLVGYSSWSDDMIGNGKCNAKIVKRCKSKKKKKSNATNKKSTQKKQKNNLFSMGFIAKRNNSNSNSNSNKQEMDIDE
eukprot:310799_1